MKNRGFQQLNYKGENVIGIATEDGNKGDIIRIVTVPVTKDGKRFDRRYKAYRDVFKKVIKI